MVCLAIATMEKCTSPQSLSTQYCKVYSKQVSVMMQVVNVVTDIYVLVLPIHRVLALHLSGKHKLGLLLIFLCGIGWVQSPFSLKKKKAVARLTPKARTCAASLTRLIIFCVHYHDPDILWIQARNSIFTYVFFSTL